ELRIDDGIGAIGGDDAASPAAVADRLMMEKRIERRFGRRDHLDAEALEQRARTIRIFAKACADPVEIPIGAIRGQALVDAEDRVERMVEPQPRRRAAKERVVRSEQPPDRACIVRRAYRGIVRWRYAKQLERDALAVQHPENVVIGNDEERRRIRERRVVGVPLRIGVSMGTDDRQVAHGVIKRSREPSRGRIGGKEAIGMEIERDHETACATVFAAPEANSSISQRMTGVVKRGSLCRSSSKIARIAKRPCAKAAGSPRCADASDANDGASGSETSMRRPRSSSP